MMPRLSSSWYALATVLAKFAERREFMETEFVRKNNEQFGYKRFNFLYLEDTLSAEQRRQKTLVAINDFFNL